jgi:hypothetical protein
LKEFEGGRQSFSSRPIEVLKAGASSESFIDDEKREKPPSSSAKQTTDQWQAALGCAGH